MHTSKLTREHGITGTYAMYMRTLRTHDARANREADTLNTPIWIQSSVLHNKWNYKMRITD